MPFSGLQPVVPEGYAVSGAVKVLRTGTGNDGVPAVSLELGDDMGNNRVHSVAFLPDGSKFRVDFFCRPGLDLMKTVFQLIGGLARFLLGIRTMSESLQRVGGPRMRTVLKRLTGYRYTCLMTGAMTTAMVKSSSATVGLTMTLAGAGLISVEGALYLVPGGNTGTTVTAQLAAVGASRPARRTALSSTMIKVVEAVYFALILSIGGFVALGLTAGGVVFGFDLGLGLLSRPIALAGGSVLYDALKTRYATARRISMRRLHLSSPRPWRCRSGTCLGSSLGFRGDDRQDTGKRSCRFHGMTAFALRRKPVNSR